MTEFIPFRKIPRLSRNCIITEKIDGTNASIHIKSVSDDNYELNEGEYLVETNGGLFAIRGASRRRYISQQKDNFGFASWIYNNRNQLVALGEGIHFGEWWGRGIQRGYNLQERRFSLFNVNRWIDHHDTDNMYMEDGKERDKAPECCYIVPVLGSGILSDSLINGSMDCLFAFGSFAIRTEFIDGEGIIIYHTGSRSYFKKTFENDETGKWDPT